MANLSTPRLNDHNNNDDAPAALSPAFAVLVDEWKVRRHAVDHTEYGENDSDAVDAAVERMGEIARALHDVPAISLADVLAKVAIFAHDDTDLGPDGLRSIYADLRSLAGLEVSPGFAPESWLHTWELWSNGYIVQDGQVIFVHHGERDNSSWLAMLDFHGGKPAVDAIILSRTPLEAAE